MSENLTVKMLEVDGNDPGSKPNPWRDLWVNLLDDVGILADTKPDTLSIVGLSTDQCDEYTSAILGLLHEEGK